MGTDVAQWCKALSARQLADGLLDSMYYTCVAPATAVNTAGCVDSGSPGAPWVSV